MTRIDQRPKIINNKEHIGDWEGDTIVGKDKTIRILTNTERVSGYGTLNKLEEVTATLVQIAITDLFSNLPKSKRYSCTYDYGTEFSKEDVYLENKSDIKIYRDFPYHSWKREYIENYNRLVREFFPRGTNFTNIAKMAIVKVKKLLNHRPRKRLGYLTPYEVFVLGISP